MSPERIFEILRSYGGQIVASQEAFEKIVEEMKRDCLYVENPHNFGGLSVGGVSVYWHRHDFPELMDLYSKYRYFVDARKWEGTNVAK